jgi:uncharacterized protein (DUF433 family)
MKQTVEQQIVVPDYRSPADARLKDSGVSVWAIVLYYQAAGSIDEVARDYDISPDVVEAALAYYADHRTLIDARIAEHLAFFG